MSRVAAATKESIPNGQESVFDELVQQIGSVPLYGPGSVLIHVPEAHRWATGLNNYLRNKSSLPKKVQELAMLVTARELDCQHIWNAHAPSSRDAGLSEELVTALREGGDLPELAPDEEAVVNYGREYFNTYRVSRGAFQAVLELFDTQGAVELTLIMGNYSMLAFVINSFDTDLPPNRTEPLLPV